MSSYSIKYYRRKGVGRRRIQPLDNLRSRIRYWELMEKAEDRNGGNDSLSREYTEEIQVISRKSMDLLTSSILNNNCMPLIRW